MSVRKYHCHNYVEDVLRTRGRRWLSNEFVPPTIGTTMTAYSYGVANVNLHSYTLKKKCKNLECQFSVWMWILVRQELHTLQVMDTHILWH